MILSLPRMLRAGLTAIAVLMFEASVPALAEDIIMPGGVVSHPGPREAVRLPASSANRVMPIGAASKSSDANSNVVPHWTAPVATTARACDDIADAKTAAFCQRNRAVRPMAVDCGTVALEARTRCVQMVSAVRACEGATTPSEHQSCVIANRGF